MVTKAAKRPVIAPGRVPAPVYAAVKEAAAASGRPLSEELAELAHQAIEHRKRFPDASTARAFEMATLAFVAGGERRAYEKGLTGQPLPAGQPWGADLDCRREAFLSAAAVLITQYVASDPREQDITVKLLQGRIWPMVRVTPGQGGAE
jgi:hypothetical protein